MKLWPPGTPAPASAQNSATITCCTWATYAWLRVRRACQRNFVATSVTNIFHCIAITERFSRHCENCPQSAPFQSDPMSCSAGALSSPLLTAGRLAVGRRPISSMSSQLTRARQRNVAQQQQRPQQQCRAAAATEKLDAKPMQPDDFMQVCL